MKTKISTILATAALLLGASSCSESWNPAPAAGQGSLSMLSMGVNVNTSATVISRSDGIDLSAYKVKVVSLSDGSVTEYVYGTMPEIVTMPVGQYRVDVESHTVQKAEFDRPYYKGSSRNFDIKNNELTEIGVVTCNLASLKVSVAYTDELKAVMGDDVTVTVVANDEGRLVYTPEETRAGYFEVVDGSMTMVATFTGTVGGSYTEEVVTFTDVTAGQHYMITFKTKSGPTPPEQTGGIEPGGITVDSEVSEVEVNGSIDDGGESTLNPSDRPGTETGGGEGGDTPNPEPVAEFTSSTIDLDGVNDARGWSGDAIVTISCPKGISHLLVTIDSEGLTPEVLDGVGLAPEFDLAYPGDLEVGISGLGFPIKDNVIGETSVDFDITQFVPLLTVYPGKSNFIITVTDSEGGQAVKTLKFIS